MVCQWFANAQKICVLLCFSVCWFLFLKVMQQQFLLGFNLLVGVWCVVWLPSSKPGTEPWNAGTPPAVGFQWLTATNVNAFPQCAMHYGVWELVWHRREGDQGVKGTMEHHGNHGASWESWEPLRWFSPWFSMRLAFSTAVSARWIQEGVGASHRETKKSIAIHGASSDSNGIGGFERNIKKCLGIVGSSSTVKLW